MNTSTYSVPIDVSTHLPHPVLIDLAEETDAVPSKLFQSEHLDFGESNLFPKPAPVLKGNETLTFDHQSVKHQPFPVEQPTERVASTATTPSPRRQRPLTSRRRRSFESSPLIPAITVTDQQDLHHSPSAATTPSPRKRPSPKKTPPTNMTVKTPSPISAGKKSPTSPSPRSKKTLSAYQIFSQQNRKDFKVCLCLPPSFPLSFLLAILVSRC